MTHPKHSYKLLCLIIAIIILGCAPKMQKTMEICRGKGSLTESLSSLKLRSENMVPFKANGQCLVKFCIVGEKKPERENFPVKLWVNPPAQIRLHGDIALNARGLDLGSNEQQFWLAIKPKEISTYWWGNWADQNDLFEHVKVDPKLLIEALGIAETDDEQNWSLSSEGPFDVLTKQNEQGLIAKKVYVYSCDYLIRKIEYFSAKGKAVIITELNDYRKMSKDFFVPTVIEIVHRNEDGTEDSLKITLKSVEPADFTEKKQGIFFTRPPSNRFKHIFRIIEGKMVEQPE